MRPGVSAAFLLVGLSGLAWSSRGRMGGWGWTLLGIGLGSAALAYVADITRQPPLQWFTLVLVFVIVVVLVLLLITELKAARTRPLRADAELD